MENLNWFCKHLHKHFFITYSFIAFIEKHRHANVCTRILILSAKDLQTTKASMTKFGIKICFFFLHKVIFYYAVLAFLLISSHPFDCHLRGISKTLLKTDAVGLSLQFHNSLLSQIGKQKGQFSGLAIQRRRKPGEALSVRIIPLLSKKQSSKRKSSLKMTSIIWPHLNKHLFLSKRILLLNIS